MASRSHFPINCLYSHLFGSYFSETPLLLTRAFLCVCPYIAEFKNENAKKLDLCRSLLKDFIYPLHDFARNAYVWRVRPEKEDEDWWGTNYCGGERKCLKDVTIAAMDAACRSCVDSQGGCSIVLTY